MYKSSYQTQIIQNDLYSSEDHAKRLPKKSVDNKEGLLHKIIQKARKYLLVFLQTSSIHGLNHTVAFGRHPFEV